MESLCGIFSQPKSSTLLSLLLIRINALIIPTLIKIYVLFWEEMVYNKCVHSGPLSLKSALELSPGERRGGSGEVTVALRLTSFNLSL